ncbi:MAG: DUF1450 domain-containing protein [Bacilli bacterium]|nr:DUF1450 domain-containing protein [Bacilli bacterium]
MNEFKICDICNDKYVEKLKKELTALDETAEISVGCQGLCGIGASKIFVVVNGIAAIGETIEEVISKVKETMNKE